MNKTKLGNILDVRRGTSLSGEYYSNKGNRIRLTLGNFNYPSSGFKKNTAKTDIYFTGKVKPEFILKKGDIITPLTEQKAGLLGETARIPEDNIYIQSGDIGLIIPDERVLDKTFAYYLIASPLVKKQLGAAAQQTKIRHTSPDKIKDCEVYLLDIKNQKGVGFFLDTINSKIELNNRINTELETIAKTLYDYWFVQFDFPDKNGKPYKSSGGNMVWNEKLNRAIPLDWKDAELKDIANITMGQSPPGESYNSDGKGMIFFQGCTDFGNRFPTVRQFSTQPTRYAKEGDILLSVRAPVGTLNIAKDNCCIGRGLAALNSKDNCIAYLFGIMINLKQIFDRRNIDGTTFGSITKDDLFSLKVVKPDKDILKRYHEIINPVFEKQNKIELENIQLTELRDWLFPMLMNGQVKVKEAEENVNLNMAAEAKKNYGTK